VIYAGFWFHRSLCGLMQVGVRIAGVEESINPLRNFFHWIMMLPAMLMFNLVQVVSSIEASLRGKTVLGHYASNKDALSVKARVEPSGDLEYAMA